MPDEDDRFGDLGEPAKQSAAERFEHEDRVNPEPDDPRRQRPEVPRPGNRYAWVVGIVALMVIAVVFFTINLPNQGAGVRGPQPGERLPAFAAPLATSNVDDDFDANVFQTPKDARSADMKLAACQVRTESVLNSCQLRERPAVLTMIATEGTDCEPQVDRVERMRKAFPRVNFAVVMSGQKRSEAGRIVRRRGWGMPVGVDKDGAVTNLYGVGVCPTTVFSDGRGIVRRTDLGNLTEDQLRARTRALLVRGPYPGTTLPAFAAPLATSDAGDAVDANVFQDRAQARRAKARRAACQVQGESVLNSCRLRQRPSVLTFIAAKGTGCGAQVDRVERMRKEFPQVSFATVISGDERAKASEIARRRGWKMPIGVDRDGAVTNLYGIGVCPTTVFADGRGVVRRTDLGALSEDELRTRTRALLPGP